MSIVIYVLFETTHFSFTTMIVCLPIIYRQSHSQHAIWIFHTLIIPSVVLLDCNICMLVYMSFKGCSKFALSSPTSTYRDTCGTQKSITSLQWQVYRGAWGGTGLPCYCTIIGDLLTFRVCTTTGVSNSILCRILALKTVLLLPGPSVDNHHCVTIKFSTAFQYQ